MITESNYLKYDYDGHYYYLTEAGLTELTDVESGLWNDESKRLKVQGRLLHQEMVHSVYNAKDKYRSHQSLIEYKVYKNEYNEVEAIQNALITFAELSEYNELDLMIRSGEKPFPTSITKILRDANIYFKGEIIGYVPEEDYRNGY